MESPPEMSWYCESFGWFMRRRTARGTPASDPACTSDRAPNGRADRRRQTAPKLTVRWRFWAVRGWLGQALGLLRRPSNRQLDVRGVLHLCPSSLTLRIVPVISDAEDRDEVAVLGRHVAVSELRASRHAPARLGGLSTR
jgi:hypothetical protein